jgi:predicted transcriptional regulator
MNKEDIENYISYVDIKEIAAEAKVTEATVRRVLSGEIKTSPCKKLIIARIRKNKEIVF